MRVEAVSWDDWSASNAPPTQDADKWHVALAPDEVKIVSLEQLDDLFRLSIVDAETKVWQQGMTEWLPLRVIAGIEDDQPAPEPRRTHPKPPSPRSAPPPPRPPSPRSAPPPSPPSRAPVAPASVYAEPLAFAQTQNAFVAPVVPQIASVRPLIVSQAPRPVARGGGGFGRFLVGLALVAGVSVTLYRNDVVRDVAHSLHQDGQYARLQAALGGPSFGTLASLEQSGSAADRVTVSSLSAALAAAPATADEPHSAPTTHEQSPAPAPSPANTGSAPPVVSLESLKREGAGTKAAVTATSPEAPAAVAKPTAQPKPQTQTAPAPAFKAAVAKAEPVAKPAPVAKTPPPKNEADMTPRERLNAAISASMSSPASSKKGKAKAASEYDPLNPKL